ncbi:prohormone-1-like protein [Leptotrombidium deliense]|uniref:Prohormone-1-like protein n=1 Tax=Leptotrombidium deliense TaxID=299467 RepID=A0A443SBI8_9ACAR|nr:prohormone-1-like protein [Leptotrombidium deliense]
MFAIVNEEEEVANENIMLNYLLARMMEHKPRFPEMQDVQRKRKYWKQCAFNAVTCFGKRR